MAEEKTETHVGLIITKKLKEACDEQKFVALTFRADDGENVKLPCNLIKSVRRKLFDFKPDIFTTATGRIERIVAVEPI